MYDPIKKGRDLTKLSN